ncbi:MAG: hypothetical protein QY326_08190 [Bdellovibrionota bacterium]|nr:MAG: hypothetical protein QY326_08190 [Bdellovibrionota bacterium]
MFADQADLSPVSPIPDMAVELIPSLDGIVEPLVDAAKVRSDEGVLVWFDAPHADLARKVADTCSRRGATVTMYERDMDAFVSRAQQVDPAEVAGLLDGRPIQRDGLFLDPRLSILNRAV